MDPQLRRGGAVGVGWDWYMICIVESDPITSNLQENWRFKIYSTVFNILLLPSKKEIVGNS